MTRDTTVNGMGRGRELARLCESHDAYRGICGGVRVNFAGGQLPLTKALPMLKGFTNIFRIEYAVVNLETLAQFPKGSRVTPETLKEAKVLKNLKQPVKVLGRGNLERPLTVAAHRFSKAARAAIEAVGGTVEEL